MKLKRIATGAAILAAGALGGWWLFQNIPVTHGALQRACLDAHDRFLVAAYLRLPEGMTAEEYQDLVRNNCDCIAREALRQLPLADLVAYVWNQTTPELSAKVTSIHRQCAPQAP
jgi:hypothetical protein